MSPAGVEDIDLAPADFDGSLPIDEVTVKCGGIALFKTAQVPGQHRIESIGHHGQQDIEMDFDQDGEDNALRWKNLTASAMPFSTRHRRA